MPACGGTFLLKREQVLYSQEGIGRYTIGIQEGFELLLFINVHLTSVKLVLYISLHVNQKFKS